MKITLHSTLLLTLLLCVFGCQRTPPLKKLFFDDLRLGMSEKAKLAYRERTIGDTRRQSAQLRRGDSWTYPHTQFDSPGHGAIIGRGDVVAWLAKQWRLCCTSG